MSSSEMISYALLSFMFVIIAHSTVQALVPGWDMLAVRHRILRTLMPELTRDPVFFSLATPDPEFPGFTVDSDDQLPGRPLQGELEISSEFLLQHFTFFITDEQRNGYVAGNTIYSHLKKVHAPVIGPNVLQFLFEHQWLIPEELHWSATLLAWGKIYRDVHGRRYIRCLFWNGDQWDFGFSSVGTDLLHDGDQALLLAR